MSEFLKDPEKKIFYAVAGLLFILMPILSLNSGISGDEETFHYPHGKNVFNYYKTLGKDTTCLHYNNSVLHMYGPVFDLATVAAIKTIKPNDEYKVRHILNSLTGWAAIFFAGLIAVMLGGWRAGIITLIFMFSSPRFLGHSFNNPKDIPFTAAYIFTIYCIIRFLKSFPERRYRFAWPIAVGIGLTIGVRVGGILLAIYFLFFVGIHYVFTQNYKDWFKKQNLQKFFRLFLYALVISIAGYFIGILLWPYAHKAPVSKTIEAMSYMEQYATSLRQVFEGKIIWSDHVPKHYLPKYIFMTIPEFIILGLIAFFVLMHKMKKKYATWYFILLFVSIFPVSYIIFKESNVYGGWRHVMFIYPGIAIISSLGINELINVFKKRYQQFVVIGILTLLAVLPLKHIISNHPHEYIYYNAISGGVKKAYGKYEMDYFYHSLKAASDWLIKNKIENVTPGEGEKIVVASNFSVPLNYYFRNYKDKVKIVYIRYYERGNSDWDYAIIANSYINPYQLKKNKWPPVNTIKTIDVDGKPINAILERTDHSDFEGYQLMSSGNSAAAIPFFQTAIRKDKNYEMVYYNLSQAYLNTNEYDKALQAISKCLKLYPDYDRGLNLLGMIYLNKKEYNNAMQVFRKNMKENPKYVISIYYLGVIYAQNNDYNTALKYLEKSIEVNSRYKPAYYLIARIYELQGKNDLAKRYIKYANSLP